MNEPLDQPLELDGTEWRVVVVAGEPTEADVVATVRFDAGHVGGRGGVNRYRGSYELDGHALTVGPVMSTMMAGPEPAMRQEARWFRALDQPSTISLDGVDLVLVHPDGTRSRLRPVVPDGQIGGSPS